MAAVDGSLPLVLVHQVLLSWIDVVIRTVFTFKSLVLLLHHGIEVAPRAHPSSIHIVDSPLLSFEGDVEGIISTDFAITFASSKL